MSAVEMVQVSKADRDKWLARENKAKLAARKASVKNLIYVEKAKAAKIVVTKAEVDARIAKDDAEKAAGATPVIEAAPVTEDTPATKDTSVSEAEPVEDEEEKQAA